MHADSRSAITDDIQAGLRQLRRRAIIRRSASLLNDFRFEQSDPARFYTAIARDTADIIDALTPGGLRGASVLDVGGGPGYFAATFAERGAEYLTAEPDASEMHAAGIAGDAGVAVRASGMALPFRDKSFDVTYSSNVVEHVADPWAMCDEIIRVTKPKGIAIISYTLWFGPFGGHEMGMTHYLGGHRAARRYTRKHGHSPKNLYGTSLFRVTAADGLRWASALNPHSARLVGAFPRYLPGWAWPVMSVPVIREVLGTNLVLVLSRS